MAFFNLNNIYFPAPHNICTAPYTIDFNRDPSHRCEEHDLKSPPSKSTLPWGLWNLLFTHELVVEQMHFPYSHVKIHNISNEGCEAKSLNSFQPLTSFIVVIKRKHLFYGS